MNIILRLPYQIIRPVYEKTSFHRSVTQEVSAHDLRSAYEHCRSVTREYARTFYLATRFLPNKKQRSIFAIYGLCRYIDDLVDEAEDLLREKKLTKDEVVGRIELWKQNLERTYNGETIEHPILLALSDVLKEYHIPLEYPMMLIEGVSMDLVKNRYANFEELYDYSYKVASVVGLMTSEVFGYETDEALEHAVELGIAMQLTNILRDVGEDLTRGRIYLPQDELKQFGITEDDLFNHNLDDKFKSFMEFQISRAEDYYTRADKGIKMLSQDSRFPVYMASVNYGRILQRIRENGYQVFTQRAHLTLSEKLAVLPKVWWKKRLLRTQTA